MEDYAQETTVDLSALGKGPDDSGFIYFIIQSRGGKPLPTGWYFDPMILSRADDVGKFCLVFPFLFIY